MRGPGRPGRMKRVEHDLVDRPLRIFVAIDGAFDDIPELAHVAGPMIGLELGHTTRAETRPVGPPALDGHAATEMLGKQRHVVVARTQRREGDNLERETIEKVSSK